jgi:hypothetical protein
MVGLLKTECRFNTKKRGVQITVTLITRITLTLITLITRITQIGVQEVDHMREREKVPLLHVFYRPAQRRGRQGYSGYSGY